MSKTITLRLPDKIYKQILAYAQRAHRPMSNFITHVVLEKIEDSLYVDPIEMDQINSDSKLLNKLKRGHKEAKDIRRDHN